MKTLAGLSIGVLLLTCSSRAVEDAGWDIVLTGQVTNPQEGVITIREMRSDGSAKIDTIQLKPDHTFSKTVHLMEPGNYLLNYYDLQYLTVILNKSNLEINADGSNREGFYEIKGSPEHELISKVQEMQNDVQRTPEMTALSEQFNQAAQAHQEDKMEEIRQKFIAALKAGNDKIAQYLLAQPASIAVMDILLSGSYLDSENYLPVFEDASKKLKAAYPQAQVALEFSAQVEKMKKTAVGMLAPEIALPNPSGDIVKLSSLRGKYVLIDFWAKWCGPCRRENPNVVKAYKRFSGKGFEVFGVSLDRSKDDWVQAIAQDGLTWTHVSDLKYFESKAAQDYNINAIPFSILLDKNGVIIAKNLRGPALEKKLEEVLGK